MQKKLAANRFSNENLTNPLVTIITATYNVINSGRKDSFIKCLESVHNQTYSNIVHIVVDGASSDGTIEIIRKYADMGWIKYISEPDNGIYDAFNKGILESNGKYVAFLNSDDYYHDVNGVSNTLAALEKADADFSYSSCIIINETGQQIGAKKANIHSAFTKVPFMQITMFTKKEVLVKEGLFDTSFKIAADYDLMLKLLLKKYKYVFLPHMFATFRAGGASDNSELALNECATIYYKNYNKFIGVKNFSFKTIFDKDKIPFFLLINLIKICGFTFGLGMIRYYLSKNFRRWLIQIRTKKGQKTFRIFGIYFIKPKNEEF